MSAHDVSNAKTFEEVWRERFPEYRRYVEPSREQEEAWDGFICELLYPLIRGTFDDFEAAVRYYDEWTVASVEWKRTFARKWAEIYYRRAMREFSRFNMFGPDELDVDFYTYKQPWFDNTMLDYPYVSWRGHKWKSSMNLY